MPSDEEMDLNLQDKLIQSGKRSESWERNLPSPDCFVLHIYCHSASRRHYKGWGKDFHGESSAIRKKKKFKSALKIHKYIQFDGKT